MNGFGPFLGPFLWFKLYWAAWALLLGVIAVLFWVRGREPGVRRRIALARARLRGTTIRMAGVATALILAVGGFVFYNTRVLNEDPARNEVGRPQAEYERRYKRFEDAPQPDITAADLRLEVYPGEQAVDMRGGYRLVNRAGVAIDSVHVFLDRNVEVRSITFDRAARAVVTDEETGYRIFALEQALAPGDSLRLSFDLALRPRGFRSRGIQTVVVRNGTYWDRRWLPFIGYQPRFELDDVGRETETPMNDLVEIGVFGPGDGLGEPLYLQRHRIRSGKQTIRITVPRKPARAGIDPWRKLIDRDRDDNVADVTP